MRRPKAEEIDGLIARFAAAQQKVQRADALSKARKAMADQLKAELVEIVETFGAQHTAKSKRLRGLVSSATTTTATQMQIDATAVEKLHDFVATRECAGLEDRLFSRRVTYQLVDAPDNVLGAAGLPTRLRTRIAGMIGMCFRVTTKAPALRVDLPKAA